MAPPASLLSQADPHLAAIKSLALALMKEPGSYFMGDKLDMSRGKLFGAIRAGDKSGALAWLNAVELAVESAVAVIPNVEASALEAVRSLKSLLDTPRRLHS